MKNISFRSLLDKNFEVGRIKMKTGMAEFIL